MKIENINSEFQLLYKQLSSSRSSTAAVVVVLVVLVVAAVVVVASLEHSRQDKEIKSKLGIFIKLDL